MKNHIAAHFPSSLDTRYLSATSECTLLEVDFADTNMNTKENSYN